MRLTPLTATAVLVLSLFSGLGVAVPRANAAPPPGDSVIADPPGYPPVNVREGPCTTGSCTVVTAVNNGDFVKMRCWTDSAPPGGGGGYTSPRWFYVTVDTGNPETEDSGYVYSAYVGSQVSTPNCDTSVFSWTYPDYPANGYFTISPDPDSPGALTVNTYGISVGPATLYCHVGSLNDPDTGGQVTDLGTYNLPATGRDTTFTATSCGSGTQWMGIIAANGIIRYSNRLAVGDGTGPVSILAGNSDGQMTVQLVNFPLGLSYYFCHVGDPSGYPTGGSIASHGSFTVTSPDQSWPSGLCSGAGNTWIGIQATDGISYYSNQVAL